MTTTVGTTGSQRDAFLTGLKASLDVLGVDLERGQMEQLWEHFQRVVRANRDFNLTRITDPAEAAIKHYADSLSLLTLEMLDRDRALMLLDVGTGAGYPGVPLAIACPRWRITAIDGTGKKARFVAQVATEQRLKNLQAEQMRAASLSTSCREVFDVVCLRAVTSLSKGLAEVHRLVRRGGRIVFYKSAGLSPEERARGEREALRSGLSRGQAHEVTLSGTKEPLHRVLMVYEKRSGGMRG